MIETFTKRYTYLLLILAGSLFFFHHLSQPGFFLDGIIYAALGKQVLVKGAWLAPAISGTMFENFSDHIPFMLILQGLFFKVFGISFFTARLMVNLFSFVTFISMIHFTRKKASDFQVVLMSFLFIISIPMLRHTRHPNFDMPLMMSCFLAISFYFNALESERKRDWYFSGFFFGLAMLFKGPMAVFVPLTIFIHLVLTKRLRLLLAATPWLSLLLGFTIFSLWPLSLLYVGEFHVFEKWFHFTFLATIMGSRGVVTNNYFEYVTYLFTFTPINMVLMLIGFYRHCRHKLSDYYLMHFIFFLVVLGLTSIMKFKLSHYITALYPSLAIVASLGFQNGAKFKLQTGLTMLMVVAGLIVFFLPQDPKNTRDFEIFEIRRILQEKNLKPTQYTVEAGSYQFWNLVALVSFLDDLEAHEVPSSELKIEHKSSVYIVKQNSRSAFDQKCSFIYDLEKYNSSAYFCH